MKNENYLSVKMRKFCKRKKEDPQYCNTVPLNKITKPLTILLGPNGTGKSTSIRLMREELKHNKDVKVLNYSTSRDDIVATTGEWNMSAERLFYAFTSEGERMEASFFQWVSENLSKQDLKDKRAIYILIDELDSGLSVDKLSEHAYAIISLLTKLLSKKKAYVIVTGNSYELLDVFSNYTNKDVFWVPTGQRVSIRTYSEFKKKYLSYSIEMSKEDSSSDSKY